MPGRQRVAHSPRQGQWWGPGQAAAGLQCCARAPRSGQHFRRVEAPPSAAAARHRPCRARTPARIRHCLGAGWCCARQGRQAPFAPPRKLSKRPRSAPARQAQVTWVQALEHAAPPKAPGGPNGDRTAQPRTSRPQHRFPQRHWPLPTPRRKTLAANYAATVRRRRSRPSSRACSASARCSCCSASASPAPGCWARAAARARSDCTGRPRATASGGSTMILTTGKGLCRGDARHAHMRVRQA